MWTWQDRLLPATCRQVPLLLTFYHLYCDDSGDNGDILHIFIILALSNNTKLPFQTYIQLNPERTLLWLKAQVHPIACSMAPAERGNVTFIQKLLLWKEVEYFRDIVISSLTEVLPWFFLLTF